MENYSIGQIANLVGIPTSTIRFYERIGLVIPEFRTGGNYRGYSTASLQRLRFIRMAQATGLSLEDIQTLLEMTYSTKPPCDEVLSLMRRRLEEIARRIKDLKRIEKVLSESLRGCCAGAEQDMCREVCRLSGSNSAARASIQSKKRDKPA